MTAKRAAEVAATGAVLSSAYTVLANVFTVAGARPQVFSYEYVFVAFTSLAPGAALLLFLAAFHHDQIQGSLVRSRPAGFAAASLTILSAITPLVYFRAVPSRILAEVVYDGRVQWSLYTFGPLLAWLAF